MVVCFPPPSSPPSGGEILVTIQDSPFRSSLSPTLKPKAVYQYSVVRAPGKTIDSERGMCLLSAPYPARWLRLNAVTAESTGFV